MYKYSAELQKKTLQINNIQKNKINKKTLKTLLWFSRLILKEGKRSFICEIKQITSEAVV